MSRNSARIIRNLRGRRACTERSPNSACHREPYWTAIRSDRNDIAARPASRFRFRQPRVLCLRTMSRPMADSSSGRWCRGAAFLSQGCILFSTAFIVLDASHRPVVNRIRQSSAERQSILASVHFTVAFGFWVTRRGPIPPHGRPGQPSAIFCGKPGSGRSRSTFQRMFSSPRKK